MKDCIKAHRASILIEEILNGFSTQKSPYEMTTQFNELKEMDATNITPCLECAPCYDYLFYYGTLIKYHNKTLSPENLKHELHQWKKTQLRDAVLDRMEYSLQKEDFNAVNYSLAGVKVYFDQNVLSECAKSEPLQFKVNCLSYNNNLSFYYSPSHLEEINKIPDQETKKKIIDYIKKLTNNVTILPEIDSNGFYIEDPEFGLNRIAMYDGSTQVLEALMLESSKDRCLYLEKYDTNEHKSKIANNADIFNSLSDEDFRELISLSHSSLYRKDNFKNIKSRDKLLHAIYTLSSALNLLGYKLDKKEKTIKSALHDIEHLIYASEADIFITNDAGLRARANQIYKFMGIQTKIIALDELEIFLQKQQNNKV